MSSKASSSLKELRGLREAVLAEEKARTQALLQNLPDPDPVAPPDGPSLPQSVEALDDEGIDDGLPADPSVSSPVESRPVLPKPPASRPAPPPANRVKASKEPALIIPLTPKIQERLQRNVEDARWSPSELVMEIIRVTLHQGYPGIQFDDQLLAKPGTYRTYERNPLDAALKIISGQGVFSIGVTPQNPEFQQWLSHFSDQKVLDPEKSAKQVCLFALQSYLENLEDFRPQGWVKNISSDAYSIVSAS